MIISTNRDLYPFTFECNFHEIQFRIHDFPGEKCYHLGVSLVENCNLKSRSKTH